MYPLSTPTTAFSPDPSCTHFPLPLCLLLSVHQFKGKTVMNHQLRCESVRHCRWVDSVLEDAPWVLTDSYLTKHSIDFVAHDAIPYKDTSGSAVNSGDVYHHIKEKGMFLETQRTEGLSTTDIIVTIIRDYDDYVVRNLDRGYSKQELNVGASWQVRARFHEKQRDFKKSLDRMKEEQKRAEDAAIAFIREFNPKVPPSTPHTPPPHFPRPMQCMMVSPLIPLLRGAVLLPSVVSI